MYESETAFTVIARAAEETRRASSSDFPARLTRLGEDLEAELSKPVVLKRIADDLAPLLRGTRCNKVVGASALGERIAGALMATHGAELVGETLHQAPRVLVVDGVLTTGAQMQRAIQGARDSGAGYVSGVVVVADHAALQACREHLRAEVVALREF